MKNLLIVLLLTSITCFGQTGDVGIKTTYAENLSIQDAFNTRWTSVEFDSISPTDGIAMIKSLKSYSIRKDVKFKVMYENIKVAFKMSMMDDTITEVEGQKILDMISRCVGIMDKTDINVMVSLDCAEIKRQSESSIMTFKGGKRNKIC